MNTYNVTSNKDFSFGWNTNQTNSNSSITVPADYYCEYILTIDDDNFAMTSNDSDAASVFMEVEHNTVDIKKHGHVKNTVTTTYWDPASISKSTDKNGFLIGPYLKQITVIVVNAKDATIAKGTQPFELNFKSLTSVEFLKLTLMQQSPVVLIIILIVLVLLALCVWKFLGCLLCRPKKDDDDFERHHS